MNKRSGSKSTLFLMEQLIVILIFSVCAAVCVKIFVVSFITVSDANDINNALRILKSGAECYKATLGDSEKAAKILGGSAAKDNSVSVYYDGGWKVCGESEAVYILRLTEDKQRKDKEKAPDFLLFSNISVEKIKGEEIVATTVAVVRRGAK